MKLTKPIGQILVVEAKSMYLGGERITVDDWRLDKFSCHYLGLMCTVCNEPVRRRKGQINIPHFAHFPNIDTEKREDCERRRTIISGTGGPSWWEPEGKGDRLALFQEHFANILHAALSDLEIHTSIRPLHFDLLQCQLWTLNFIRKNKYYICRYVQVFHSSVSQLERNIICEAINYLLVISSEVVYMALSERLLRSDNSFENIREQRIFQRKLCSKIIDVMTKIDWIPIFSKLSEIKPGETVMAHLDRKNFSAQKRVEGSGSLFVYLHGQNLFVATVDVPQVKDERLLGNIDIIKLMKTKQPFLLKKRQQCRKVKKSQQDSKEKLPSIQFFKKGNWFYIFKEIIKKDLTPFLAKAIKGESDVDLSVVLSSKSYSGIEIHLDRSLYSFVAEKSTKIMFKDYMVCEVKIVGGVKAVYLGDEPKNNLTYTIGSFFTPSKKYSLITQQNPMIAKATVKLIQECHTALPRLD